MAVSVDTITKACLLNRYVALVEEERIGENTIRQSYHIQWCNVWNDATSVFRRPKYYLPRIAYSLIAILYIIQGKHLEAFTTAFIMGAIAYDVAAPGDDSGEVSSISYNITIGSGSDRYVLWDIQGYSASAHSSTFDGASGTTVINKANDQKVWGYVNPGSGSKTISISPASGTSIMTSVAIAFTGVDQSSPTGATTYAEGSSPLSVSLTTNTNNAMRVDFGVAINDSAQNISATFNSASPAASWNNGHNQFRVFTAVAYNAQAVAGSNSMSWSFTNSGFYRVGYAVEVKEATGSSAVYQNLMMMGMS